MSIDAPPQRPTPKTASSRWQWWRSQWQQSPHRPAVLALLGGLTMSLTPAPLNWWPLAWVAVIPLWWVIQPPLPHTATAATHQRRADQTPWRLSALLWSTAYHGIAISWITGLHPLTWMGIPWAGSVAIVAFAWSFIAFWGVASVLIWAGAMRWLGARFELTAAQRVLAGTAFWCAIEYLRSLTPLDWTALAYTQSPGNPIVLHLGQLSGNLTVTAAIVAVNGLLAEAWRFRGDRRRPRSTAKRWVSIAVGVGLLSHGIGAFLYFQPLNDSIAAALNVGIIQGNIPTRTKLSTAGIEQGIQNYTAGYEMLSKPGVDAILTSEGAMPFSWERHAPNRFDQAIARAQTPLWLGSFGSTADQLTNGQPQMHQSLFSLNGAGQTISRYDKVKLVPLGESLPPIVGNWIGRLSPLRGYLTPGMSGQQFETGFGLAGVGICYESAFAELFRRQVQQGGTFLISAANLDPYGEVLMAQQQAHDLMRSIETDRWMVRATNTGYSGVINPHGKVIWQSSPHRFDIHSERIYRRGHKTLYVQYGDWLIPLLLLITGVTLLRPAAADR
jgi:apolipoprotein N-acyltransferase